MTQIQGKVAAVTGAASGIGRALAQELAAKGAALALSDVDAAGLAETKASLGQTGLKVTTHIVDVRKRAEVQRYVQEVEQEHGGVDIVINNAGVAVRGNIEDLSYEDFELVIDVNLWGVIHGSKLFMPLLRKRPEGHIVNIGSINSMVPFPANGPYNISKYAVLALCETLWQELEGEPITVTCVHPGGVRTNIVRNARGMGNEMATEFDRIAITSATQAARKILKAVARNQKQVFVGTDAKVMATAKRLFPKTAVRVVGRFAKRMNHLD